MRAFWPFLIAVQTLICLFLLLVFGANIGSGVRNPEVGLAGVIIGIPLVLGEFIALGLLYLYRDRLPEGQSDRIMLFSTALAIVGPAVLFLAMMGNS